MHRDGDVRPDTVGKPLPKTECRISEEGEILSRSPSVCKGYYKLPDKTAELLIDGGCTPAMPDTSMKTVIWW
jgi:long-chain acyl-CoA synthetase